MMLGHALNSLGAQALGRPRMRHPDWPPPSQSGSRILDRPSCFDAFLCGHWRARDARSGAAANVRGRRG